MSQDQKERRTAFLRELADLFDKHRVRIERHDDYDGEDRCCGTTYTLTIGDNSSCIIELTELEGELANGQVSAGR